MKQRTTAILAAIVLTFAVFATGQEKTKPMSTDYPNHANQYIWIGAFYQEPDPADIPAGVVIVGYRESTNRIVIFESNGDRREIPSAQQFPSPLEPAINSLLMLDSNGNLGTTRAGVATDVNPLYGAGSTPLNFPSTAESEVDYGDVLAVSEVFSTLGVDGTTVREAYGTALVGAETRLTGKDGFALDLNSTSNQTAYAPSPPATWQTVITRIVVRDPTISMDDGGTSHLTGGFDAGASDVFDPTRFVELTTTGLYSVVYPKPGAKIGAAGASLKLILSDPYGTGTARVDVFGYTRR